MNAQRITDLQQTVQSFFSSPVVQDQVDGWRRNFKEHHMAVFDDFAAGLLRNDILVEADDLVARLARRRDMIMPTTGNTPRYYYAISRDDIVRYTRLIPFLYRSEELLSLLSTVVGEPLVPVPYEPEEIIMSHMVQAGDTHGWHWDDYSYALVWILRSPPPGGGGEVETVKDTSWDKDDPRVDEWLSRGPIERHSFNSGDAYLLKTNTTMHRVTPIQPGMTRTMICFSYASLDDLDKDISHETVETIYLPSSEEG